MGDREPGRAPEGDAVPPLGSVRARWFLVRAVGLGMADGLGAGGGPSKASFCCCCCSVFEFGLAAGFFWSSSSSVFSSLFWASISCRSISWTALSTSSGISGSVFSWLGIRATVSPVRSGAAMSSSFSSGSAVREAVVQLGGMADVEEEAVVVEVEETREEPSMSLCISVSSLSSFSK